MPPHEAYISLGSNMGNPFQNCIKGIGSLSATDALTITAQSPFYRTEPVDYLDQEWFINAVVRIITRLSPEQLLTLLQTIQRNAGRSDNGLRFGPRILDLDILLYDNLICSSPGLTIPHPRMHIRRFVLQPICDINPRIVHPVLNRDMADLLNDLNFKDQKIVRLDDC